MRARSLLLLLLCPALGAQSVRRTGHPQDVPHTNTGQLVPLSNGARYAAGRSQLHIEPHQLPGPGAVLVGIEANAMSGGVVTYSSLTITVSPVAAAASRSSVFDQNLPSPTIIHQSSGQVAWQAGAWHPPLENITSLESASRTCGVALASIARRDSRRRHASSAVRLPPAHAMIAGAAHSASTDALQGWSAGRSPDASNDSRMWSPSAAAPLSRNGSDLGDDDAASVGGDDSFMDCEMTSGSDGPLS